MDGVDEPHKFEPARGLQVNLESPEDVGLEEARLGNREVNRRKKGHELIHVYRI